jgi:hypothetical protein
MSFILIPVKHSPIVAGLTGIFAAELNAPPPVGGGGTTGAGVTGETGVESFFLHALVLRKTNVKNHKKFLITAFLPTRILSNQSIAFSNLRKWNWI